MLGRLMQPVEEGLLPGRRDVIDMASGAVGLCFSFDRRQARLGQFFEISIEVTCTNMPDSSEFALKFLVKLVRMPGARHQKAQQDRMWRRQSILRHRILCLDYEYSSCEYSDIIFSRLSLSSRPLVGTLIRRGVVFSRKCVRLCCNRFARKSAGLPATGSQSS